MANLLKFHAQRKYMSFLLEKKEHNRHAIKISPHYKTTTTSTTKGK